MPQKRALAVTPLSPWEEFREVNARGPDEKQEQDLTHIHLADGKISDIPGFIDTLPSDGGLFSQDQKGMRQRMSVLLPSA